jgi:hypothetical protein
MEGHTVQKQILKTAPKEDEEIGAVYKDNWTF